MENMSDMSSCSITNYGGKRKIMLRVLKTKKKV